MTLRLILGDQLNPNHSWFKTIDHQVLYVMMEVRQETDYVMHHIQKILAFFSAMRDFARQLTERGHQVIYLTLDDPENTQSIPQNLLRLISQKNIHRFEYQSPDEYRLDRQLRDFCASLSISSAEWDSEHFLSSRNDVANHFQHKKIYLMESFYRMMRKRYGFLMDDNRPVGGLWNFDRENRAPYDGQVPIPSPIVFQNDIRELKSLLQKLKVKTFGECENELIWPINRQQALKVLDFFVKHCLPYFGRYEDAMAKDHWSIFHSRLSFALNTKMLHPMEVVKSALNAWEQDKSKISLAQIEAFVRQIIGWREYLRGVYWARMPDYAHHNYFGHHRPLPRFFWDGDTKMQCLRYCIRQSLRYAFAHHIQRLMVTGNFALLAGIDPDEVDAWYLGIYIDAIQWVEITNTRGMSQFADGGLVATKPYVSTAKYIQKMSDYCSGCYYAASKKYGDRACPFNSLYWAFYQRHLAKLAKNPRIAMMYRVFDRFTQKEQSKILSQAEKYLERIEQL